MVSFSSIFRRFSTSSSPSSSPSPPPSSRRPESKESKESKECKDDGVVGPPGGAALVPPSDPEGELVSASVVPLKHHVLTGVSNTIPVLISIKTGALPQSETKTRVPLNLAIVLDRSGSMSGPKLDNSKKAVIKIIENLHPEDIVHFVCYGTKIVTIFSNKQPKDKHELIKMVEKVSTEGCTNLSGGIEQGAALLNQHHKKGYTKRMFLFSDGLANEGVRDMDGITKIVGNLKNKHTIKVDSFGIGHDFDSNMMKNIAEYGSGAFFFIDQADEIPTLVNKALEGLLELVGEDCILTLRGVGSGVVKKIHGRDAQSLVSGANLGDLHQSNTRTQLAELEVAPKSEGQISVLNWELSFKPHNHNKRTVITGTLQLTASSDSNIVKKSAENDDVKVAVAVQKAGDSDEQIQNLLSQGRAKEALQEQSRQCAYIQEFAHQDKSGMMKNLLSNARKTEAMIRSEGASKKAFQKMSHNVYAKRRGSVKFASHYS